MRHLMCLVLIAGCAGSGTVAYHGSASGTVYADAPDLVYVSPGVQVIADYDEPIFYTDGFYWRFYGGTWYRSRTYTGGWIYASAPQPLRRIDRPYAYVRYRPQGYVSRRDRRDNRPTYRDDRPVVRDHRAQPQPQPRPQPQPQPQPRSDWKDDLRDNRRDQREERRDDRREERQEQREEKREDKREDKREQREERRDWKDDLRDKKRR